jgi:hypothetical protein
LFDESDADVAVDARAIDLARGVTTRGYGLNEADHHDLFPGI